LLRRGKRNSGRARTRIIYAHCGTLGIGLLPDFLGRELGRELIFSMALLRV
jgi:hypothetical protein